MRARSSLFLAGVLFQWCAGTAQAQVECPAQVLPASHGAARAWKMEKGIAAYAKLNINIDGYERAYHRNNYKTDAVIHLCNAGQVFLPDGTSYHGSATSATCTGKFMADLAKIEAAGWADPKVGVVRWYGVLGTGAATVRGRKIAGVKPALQKDGSGYFVSPTALFDSSVAQADEQSRYVHPLKVPAAVIPTSLQKAGIRLGSFGVAYSRASGIAVPFVVGDFGPRIGEGTPALARQLAGLPPADAVTRKNRYAGQVDTPSVLWVFFGGEPSAYRHDAPGSTVGAAKQAYENWGGAERLKACQQALSRP